jgi:ABC-type sugar transport system permease subunit
VFYVYVNLDTFYLSFVTYEGEFTLQNFADVFNAFVSPHGTDDWTLGDAVGRSVFLYFFGWLFWFPAQMSCYILFKKIWGHYAFRTIFMIPSLLGGLVNVIIYKNMVASINGGGPLYCLANEMFDLSDEALRRGLLKSDQTAWITLLCLHYIPHVIGFNMVQTGAYARIPGELFEVGRLDGMGFFREFMTLAIPLTWSTITIGLTTGIAGFFTGDIGVFLYTEGQYNTATMGFILYWEKLKIAESGSVTAYNYPAALGLTVTFATIPLVLLMRWLTRHVEEVTY